VVFYRMLRYMEKWRVLIADWFLWLSNYTVLHFLLFWIFIIPP